MKKTDLETEKAFIDYLVETIKEKNLSSLEVTRSFKDEHRLKIKICNSDYFPARKESIITSNYSQVPKEEIISNDNLSNSSLKIGRAHVRTPVTA